jgi:hypothetical protein
LKKIVEQNKPRRLSRQAGTAPRQKIRPLNYPMNFPPPIFYFLAERAGFSGGSPTASGGGAVAKAAEAAALRAYR